VKIYSATGSADSY